MPGRAGAASTASKASSCAAGVRVGRARRPPRGGSITPSSTSAGLVAMRRGRARRPRPAAAPTRCIPVSTLRCTRRSSVPAARGRRGQPVDAPAACRRRRGAPCGDDAAVLVAAAARPARGSGASMPGCAQLDALLDEGHAQALGAGRRARPRRHRRRRRGRSRRPSPRPRPPPAPQPAQHADVVADGAEVDLGPGRATARQRRSHVLAEQPARRAGGREGRRRRARAPARARGPAVQPRAGGGRLERRHAAGPAARR